MASPQWASAERQAQLVAILTAYLADLTKWQLDLYTGMPLCKEYDQRIKGLIAYWCADDRIAKRIEWELERIALHSLGERRYPIRGRFNNISADIWHDSQPVFSLEGLGMSGLTLTPFARVKLSSSYMRLYIDLGNTLKHTSKNARRKAIRYGKSLPLEIEKKVNELIRLAVKDYLR